jgi:hypothetical protein
VHDALAPALRFAVLGHDRGLPYLIVLQLGPIAGAGVLLVIRALSPESNVDATSLQTLLNRAMWTGISSAGLFLVVGYCWAVIAMSSHTGMRAGLAETLRIASGLAGEP